MKCALVIHAENGSKAGKSLRKSLNFSICVFLPASPYHFDGHCTEVFGP